MKMHSRKRISSVFALGTLCVVVVACARPSPCRDWTGRVRELTLSERSQLDKYGASAVRGEVLFGTAVVADCELRGRFSRYASGVIRGAGVDTADAMAVHRNHQKFVSALTAVWPTRRRHFPGSDGAFREQLSNLLVVEEVKPSSMRPLLAKIIHDDGMSAEVAYALLTRPDSFFELYIRRLHSEARSVRDKILALAVLQRMGDNTRAQLVTLSQRDDLTPSAKAAIQVLLTRSSTNEPPQWDDVIDVTLE